MAIDYTKCLCGEKFDFAGFNDGLTDFVCPSLCPCTISLNHQGNPDEITFIVESSDNRMVYLYIDPSTEYWDLVSMSFTDSKMSSMPIVSGYKASTELNLNDGIGAIVKQLELYSFLG